MNNEITRYTTSRIISEINTIKDLLIKEYFFHHCGLTINDLRSQKPLLKCHSDILKNKEIYYHNGAKILTFTYDFSNGKIDVERNYLEQCLKQPKTRER